MAATIIINGCTVSPARPSFDPPVGELFIGVQIVDCAFCEAPFKNQTGFFLYVEDHPDGPFVDGYEYRDGQIVDVFGGGTDNSRRLIRDFGEIDFEPFDYDAELENAAKAKQSAGNTYDEITMDGAEWKITIVTDKGDFHLVRWNPGSDIENYSGYSQNLAKLEAVLELVATYYGTEKIGIL